MVDKIKKDGQQSQTSTLLNIKISDIFTVADVYTLIMLGLYSILLIIYFQSVEDAADLIFISILIPIWIIAISVINEKINAGRLFLLFRRLSIVPIIFYIYMVTHELLPQINPFLWDEIFINIDLLIFGVNPTEWIYHFSNPLLTELLQISYWLFFIIILINGIELHIKKKDKEFYEFAALIMFSFYLTYILYIVFPTIGPRFTIHDFSNISSELPGLLFTEVIREQINTGAGLIGEVANPAAIVNRDCMPSGHTALTIINIILAFKFRSYFRWIILLIGIGIIISTVYLRYHYIVDVLAGIVTALLIMIIEPTLSQWIERIKQKL